MQYHIRMQIFSGLPDPEWILDETESRSLVDRLLARREAIRPVSDDAGGLGYRGFEVTRLAEDEDVDDFKPRLRELRQQRAICMLSILK